MHRSLTATVAALALPKLRDEDAVSGVFDWTCANGRISGRVLLATTTPWSIQALNYRLIPNAP
ncbi:hypothetical protein [Brevundimonas sp. DC300-4]|uniref:hypothetical protein n=1 Tax=unclassified Brevundimonas TaxID=2622653 RepID=UPI003CF7F324